MKVAIEMDALPVRLRFDRPMSDEELLRFCAENDPLRIERMRTGEIVMMSPTGSGTGAMNSEINYELQSWARGGGGGVVFNSNTGFTLPDGSVLSPDASWLRSERWQALSDDERSRFAPVCPEFVMELRSPSDQLAELKAKMQQWVKNGAGLAWLIDPTAREVMVYRAGEAEDVMDNPTSVQGTGCMAGFELVMSRIWS